MLTLTECQSGVLAGAQRAGRPTVFPWEGLSGLPEGTWEGSPLPTGFWAFLGFAGSSMRPLLRSHFPLAHPFAFSKYFDILFCHLPSLLSMHRFTVPSVGQSDREEKGSSGVGKERREVCLLLGPLLCERPRYRKSHSGFVFM